MENIEVNNNMPNKAFSDWLDGLGQIQIFFGEKYGEFINDFNEFKKNNFYSYAVAGKYVITCPTYVYETDKYLKYINESKLKDIYVEFDTTKYLTN